MLKIESEATKFLVNRIMGSPTKVELNDNEVKAITLRIDSEVVAQIDRYMELTGWSRNLVATFLLMGGIELVEHQLKDRDFDAAEEEVAKVRFK